MISFIPRVGKVQTGQSSGGFTVIIPKINFQDCKFLICFYSLSNEFSNKSFVILFYILEC